MRYSPVMNDATSRDVWGSGRSTLEFYAEGLFLHHAEPAKLCAGRVEEPRRAVTGVLVLELVKLER